MLQDILRQNRQSVLDRWFDRVIDTYHPDSKKHFSSRVNRFANPVGSQIREGIEAILDGLLDGLDARSESMAKHLDVIVRIRAVQDFSASQAVGYLFFLKEVVRDLAGKQPGSSIRSQELWNFDSRVDALALYSFDIYSQCREKLFDIRVYEVKSQVRKILEVIERKSAKEEVESDRTDDNADSVT
ncbi:MAG: RsbRD N-terminal domain-containing protein [Thermodesulfobacteriota bacterium]